MGIFLKSVPELPATSALTSEELAQNLFDIYEHQPNNGDEIVQKLGLTKFQTKEPQLPQEAVNDIQDYEIDSILAGAINKVKEKILSSKKKHTPEESASLILNEVPLLSQTSSLNENQLKEKLILLHTKQTFTPSEVVPLLHLDPNAAKQKSIKIKTEAIKEQPELFKIKLKTRRDDGIDQVMNDDINSTLAKPGQEQQEVFDIKLKTLSEEEGLSSRQMSKTDDVNQYLDNLSNMLENMKLQPTVLEPIVKSKHSSENGTKVIKNAVKAAQNSTRKIEPSKIISKKEQAELFVEALVKEIPAKELPESLDKVAMTRRVSLIPSLDSLSPSEEDDIVSFIEKSKGNKTNTQFPKPPTPKSLEKALKDSLSLLKQKKKSGHTEKPEKFLFPEIFLKSVPELPATSALTSEELAQNLFDIYEHQPNNGDEIVQKLGLTKFQTKEPQLPQEAVDDIQDYEIDSILAGAINKVKEKILSSKKKHTPEESASLILNEVPLLSQTSSLNENQLKEKLILLHTKQTFTPSEVVPLLHLDPNAAKQKSIKIKTEAIKEQPELFKIKLKTRRDDGKDQVMNDDMNSTLAKPGQEQQEVFDIKLKTLSEGEGLSSRQMSKTEDVNQYL